MFNYVVVIADFLSGALYQHPTSECQGKILFEPDMDPSSTMLLTTIRTIYMQYLWIQVWRSTICSYRNASKWLSRCACRFGLHSADCDRASGFPRLVTCQVLNCVSLLSTRVMCDPSSRFWPSREAASRQSYCSPD